MTWPSQHADLKARPIFGITPSERSYAALGPGEKSSSLYFHSSTDLGHSPSVELKESGITIPAETRSTVEHQKVGAHDKLGEPIIFMNVYGDIIIFLIAISEKHRSIMSAATA